jgi:hypothetical protein
MNGHLRAIHYNWTVYVLRIRTVYVFAITYLFLLAIFTVVEYYFKLDGAGICTFGRH